MHGSGADAERLCRFKDASASRQLRPDALNDIAGALEFTECAEHLKHRLTGRRGGIEALWRHRGPVDADMDAAYRSI
jgi:hypothetical protein